MTDNEIIKALECCKDRRCDICVRLDSGHNEECICRLELIDHALDLINRQKAEIERLEYCNEVNVSSIATLHQQLKNAKSEAIKEFAGMLKKEALYPYPDSETKIVDVDDIDNLVKEMTEG